MGDNLANTRNNFTVDCLSVTEYMEETFSFQWNICNFKYRLEDKDPKAQLRSDFFNYEGEKRRLTWQVSAEWTVKEQRPNSTEVDEFMSVFLFLVNFRQFTRVDFQFELLNAAGEPWLKLSTKHKFTSSTKGYGWKKFLNTASLLDPNNKLLEDDTFKLRCKIVVKTDIVNHDGRSAADTSKNDTLSDYTNMFNSSHLSDVSINTQTKTIRAHKNVLSCRSPVFFAMFQNEMSESINNIVEMPDYDEDVVKGMLQYIYGGEISQEILTERSLEVFQIAEKYDIKGLKRVAENYIAGNFSVENIEDTVILADMNNALNLRRRALKFINKNRTKLMKKDGFQKILRYNPLMLSELYLSQ